MSCTLYFFPGLFFILFPHFYSFMLVWTMNLLILFLKEKHKIKLKICPRAPIWACACGNLTLKLDSLALGDNIRVIHICHKDLTYYYLAVQWLETIILYCLYILLSVIQIDQYRWVFLGLSLR